MNDKDQRVLEKIRQHIDAILRYCQGCESLEDFQSDTMLVEATVFNLRIVWDTVKEDIPRLRDELDP